ncbi:MAG: HAD hydrolase-like protein [Fibrobacter sp.]|uniref:HAD-IIA family hydrolase n=1 Tax=Fibrobacter sp. UWH5 TaxID=1896211 RepID=UPI0009215BDB|nr:HAD hydrolase-like protein [Fibrobacter sp. UWH5]MDO4946435.1 HAD hydrolase-like protein [Fibrobacter sp.]SHL36399.1 Ribonucleotide monophosphatase NagD, HAD superfamily [Fibrobacter sp. UWH5]
MEFFETEIYKRYLEILNRDGCLPQNRDGLGAQGLGAAEPQAVSFGELLEKYDAFCFDGYGTLYNRGAFVYPGARDWFAALRSAGKQVRLITNAASDVDRVLAADAAKRGFDFSEAETISSGSLLKDLVKELRAGTAANANQACGPLKLREVYYIGRETGKNVLAECGMTAVAPDEFPEEPVVAISSAKDTDETYARAVEILRRPGAILLVLNSDAWAPKIDGSREPVSGALCERLRRESVDESNGGNGGNCGNGGKGCTTYYLGKPFPAIWKKVSASLPESLFNGRKPRVVMIGDTLGTDVLGARVAGFDSALVVGRNEPAAELLVDELELGIRPDFYL